MKSKIERILFKKVSIVSSACDFVSLSNNQWIRSVELKPSEEF